MQKTINCQIVHILFHVYVPILYIVRGSKFEMKVWLHFGHASHTMPHTHYCPAHPVKSSVTALLRISTSTSGCALLQKKMTPKNNKDTVTGCWTMFSSTHSTSQATFFHPATVCSRIVVEGWCCPKCTLVGGGIVTRTGKLKYASDILFYAGYFITWLMNHLRMSTFGLCVNKLLFTSWYIS